MFTVFILTLAAVIVGIALIARSMRAYAAQRAGPDTIGVDAIHQLVWSELGNGSGYVMQRITDQQRLAWRRLEAEIEGVYVFEVAGESHYRDQIQGAPFAPGAIVALVPEPKNHCDPHAVAVRSHSRILQCGYVPRDEAELVGDIVRRYPNLTAMVMWAQRSQRGTRVALRILIAENGLRVRS